MRGYLRAWTGTLYKQIMYGIRVPVATATATVSLVGA